MSEALMEAYRENSGRLPQDMLELLRPRRALKSVEERGEEAVKRIYARIDAIEADKEVADKG